MKKLLLLIFLSVVLQISISKGQEAPKVDMIILVNGQLVEGGLENMYLLVGDTLPKKINVGYVPGHLILNSTNDTAIYNKIVSLNFIYATFKKDKEETQSFKVELTPFLRKQPYLILNFYDFHDKKYKHWYQSEKNKDFAVDITFPGSGLLIRNK